MLQQLQKSEILSEFLGFVFLMALFVQLMSSRAQQVATILQRAGSVYWSTLRDIYRDVQEGRNSQSVKTPEHNRPLTSVTPPTLLRSEEG